MELFNVSRVKKLKAKVPSSWGYKNKPKYKPAAM